MDDPKTAARWVSAWSTSPIDASLKPASALSIPPMMFSRVDLPEPEGPSRTQISPRATENVIPRRTSCRVSPLP